MRVKTNRARLRDIRKRAQKSLPVAGLATRRTRYDVKTNYLRRDGAAAAVAGNFTSWPARSSTSAVTPFKWATSFASRFRAAAILAIVSPLRARTLVNRVLLDSVVPGLARCQLASRIPLLGTTSLEVV